MNGMCSQGPSGQHEHVRRFKTESEAKIWIASDRLGGPLTVGFSASDHFLSVAVQRLVLAV
jgi:hypothetical protein